MPKKIEYTEGQTLGPYNIVFVREIDPYIRPDGRKERKGEFICPFCEKIFSTTFYCIKTGKTQSCGCYRKKKISEIKKQNLIGQKFGKLTVIKEKEANQKGQTIWLCKCDCGNYCEVITASLNNGHTKSCGCLVKETAIKNGRKVIHNLVGQRFGRLKVLEETAQRSGTNIVWKCLCDCGNITYVEGPSLLKGNTQSCGCFQKECCQKLQSKNLLNQKFGKLMVIEKINERKNTQVQWRCLCDCGNTIIVTTYNLCKGITKSCGCLKMSNGEIKVKEVLDNLQIQYQQEYQLLNNQRFDFYLPDYNCAIEYDGKQHFEPIEFFGGEDEFKKTKIRDNIKNQYCKDNHIQLIRIPYTIETNEEIAKIVKKELNFNV